MDSQKTTNSSVFFRSITNDCLLRRLQGHGKEKAVYFSVACCVIV